MYKEILRYEPMVLENLKSPKIACIMMVKNEHKRIHVSLESVKNTVVCFIILDTGSEDDTIEIITTFCKNNKKNLYLISEKFVDFSYSRNSLLDYSDTFEVDYLLLLDCNDELKNGDKLLEFAKAELTTADTSYNVTQEWLCGVDITTYHNTRFVKPRTGWRYKCPVHEYMDNKHGHKTYKEVPLPIKLYQDRTQDDDKTSKRFYRDKRILMREHLKDPKDCRTVFYLAQTYSCLNEYEESYKYYEMRSKMMDGFWEERFQSYLRLGNIAKILNKPKEVVIDWYMKALSVSPRAEPLIEMATLIDKDCWYLSYQFSRLACELNFPKNEHLFVSDLCYSYTRYHKMGIYAYYQGDHTGGKNACLKAIEARNQQVDKDNLNHYLENEKKMKMTKNEYFKKRQADFKGSNLPQKAITNKIKTEWRNKTLVV